MWQSLRQQRGLEADGTTALSTWERGHFACTFYVLQGIQGDISVCIEVLRLGVSCNGEVVCYCVLVVLVSFTMLDGESGTCCVVCVDYDYGASFPSNRSRYIM